MRGMPEIFADQRINPVAAVPDARRSAADSRPAFPLPRVPWVLKRLALFHRGLVCVVISGLGSASYTPGTYVVTVTTLSSRQRLFVCGSMPAHLHARAIQSDHQQLRRIKPRYRLASAFGITRRARSGSNRAPNLQAQRSSLFAVVFAPQSFIQCVGCFVKRLRRGFARDAPSGFGRQRGLRAQQPIAELRGEKSRHRLCSARPFRDQHRSAGERISCCKPAPLSSRYVRCDPQCGQHPASANRRAARKLGAFFHHGRQNGILDLVALVLKIGERRTAQGNGFVGRNNKTINRRQCRLQKAFALPRVVIMGI